MGEGVRTCSSILVMISLVCSLTMSGSRSSNMAAMLVMNASGSCMGEATVSADAVEASKIGPCRKSWLLLLDADRAGWTADQPFCNLTFSIFLDFCVKQLSNHMDMEHTGQDWSSAKFSIRVASFRPFWEVIACHATQDVIKWSSEEPQ